MRLYAIIQSAVFTSQQLKLNPLNLADCDLILGPVVELGGPGRLMRSPARSSHGIDSRSFLASSRLQTGVLLGLESVKDAAGNH
jgi:hypothetical protein